MTDDDQQARDALLATLDLSDLPEAARPDATLQPTMAPRFRRKAIEAERERRRDSIATAGESTIRLKSKLADGGMGRVYLAEQVALHREVAVKTLRDEFLDADFAERLVREARITGLVEHPNIVPVYSLRSDERGAPLMIMRRIEGVSLRAIIKDPSHPQLEADRSDPLAFHLRVLKSVCDALSFAHSRGILHLDVKPENVMVGAFHEVVLVDWGVARSTREEHRGLLPMVDETTEVLGTPAYLAPEVLDPKLGTLTQRTDVFLIGATLYEVLAGHPPYRGETVREILTEAYLARPPELPESTPKELSAIVRRAMSSLPESRYATVSEFRSAVERFERHRTSSKLGDAAAARLEALRQDVAAAPTTTEGLSRLLRRFSECRFAFTEALREWPENTRALDGMTEVSLLLVEFHLAREEYSAARSVLGELAAEVSDELAPRLARARREVEAAWRDALQQRERREQNDDVRSRRARAYYVLGIIGTVVLPMFVGFALERTGHYEWQSWHSIGYAVAVLVVGVLGALAMRKTLMPNRVSRRYVVTFGWLALALVARRVLAYQMGYRDFSDIAMDVFLFGVGTGVIGFMMDKRFFAVASACLITAFVISIAPQHALLLVALAGVIGPGTMAALWIYSDDRRRKTGADRADRASRRRG